MQVNFFDNQFKTASSLMEFGLCDSPPRSENPAYIDEVNSVNWIGIVKNNNRHTVNFYPIDHCVPLHRPKIARGKYKSVRKFTQILFDLFGLKERDNICDGMLFYNKDLIFVELKERETGGWLKDGVNQLSTTINHFRKNHLISDYNNVEAYVCNRLRPSANTGNSNQIQRFKNDTGLILNVRQDIIIPEDEIEEKHTFHFRFLQFHGAIGFFLLQMFRFFFLASCSSLR